jgi:hypothetical protein
MPDKLDPQGQSISPEDAVSRKEEPDFSVEGDAVADKAAKDRAKQKASEKTAVEKEGALYKIGAGTTKRAQSKAARTKFEGIGSDGLSGKKPTFEEEIDGMTAEVMARIADWEEPDREDFMKAFKGLMRGARYRSAEFELEGHKRFIASQMSLRDTQISNLKSAYFMANGDLDMAAIESRVGRMVDKPETSKQALEALMAKGAGQMDAPEMDRSDIGAIVEMAVASIGDIITNASAIAEGGQSLIARATTDPSSTQAFANAATMLATDVAVFREKKEDVKKLNFALRQKHEDDIIGLMSEFEQRATADERAYQQMKLQTTMHEVANAYRVLGIDMDIQNMIGQVDMGMDILRNSRNAEEARGRMAVDQFNAQEWNRMAAVATQLNEARDHAIKIEKEKRLAGFMPAVESINLLSAMGLDTAAVRGGLNAVANMPINESNTAIIGGAENMSGRIWNITQDLIRQERLIPQQANNVINNISALGADNIGLSNITEDSVMAIADRKIATNADAQAFFTKRPELFVRRSPGDNPAAMITALSLSSKYATQLKFTAGAKRKAGEDLETVDSLVQRTWGKK